MPLIPDEEEFDPRVLPWAIDAGDPGDQPDAVLSEDATGDPDRLLEIDPVPDPRFESEPDEQQPPQDAAQAQAIPPQLTPDQQRQAIRTVRRGTQASRRREEVQDRRVRQGRAVQATTERLERREAEPAPLAAARKPAFPPDWIPQGGGVQHVVASLDIPDEVPLAEDRTIAREDPGLAMESMSQIAEMEDQLASTIEVQSRNIHNTLSRLRDVETAFMRTNYV